MLSPCTDLHAPGGYLDGTEKDTCLLGWLRLLLRSLWNIIPEFSGLTVLISKDSEGNAEFSEDVFAWSHANDRNAFKYRPSFIR